MGLAFEHGGTASKRRFSAVILGRYVINVSTHSGGGRCSSSLFQALVLLCIYSLTNQSSSTGKCIIAHYIYEKSTQTEFKASLGHIGPKKEKWKREGQG